MRNLAALLLLTLTVPAQQREADMPVFRTSANLVVVNVFVKSKDGKSLADLKKEDFQILENGKPQTISVFEYQNLETAAVTAGAALLPDAPTPTTSVPASTTASEPEAGRIRYRDRRLLVLFFDWSSMQPAEQIRAREAATKFITEQMTPADLVSIMSFSTKLTVHQEFTADRDMLIDVIRKFEASQMNELTGEDAETETAEEGAYVADDTEFNVFNTDRKLGALSDASAKLGALAEKKALIYFSSGVGRTGRENEAQLRSTVNEAVRANVSLYPVDVRGLAALPPGGDASTAASSGTGLFSGQTQRRQRDKLNNQQETLDTLAADTGGRALIDSNDLTAGIRAAQEDLDSYYIVGYYSTDDRRDGQFRRVEVKLASRLNAKLDYRRGYFADKEFKAFNSYDKEKQLEDALLLGDPLTELPIAVEVDWFRMSTGRYFASIAVKMPGSVIPLAKAGSAEKTQFDFIGQVRDERGAIAANVRDNINIQLRDENAGKLASHNLLYDTGILLGTGTYKLKMLVRENQTGQMGTFSTTFQIPDLGNEKEALRLSSVVWSSQRAPYKDTVGSAGIKKKRMKLHPLVNGEQKLVPSVTRVFRNGQTVYAYAEAYDPGGDKDAAVRATVSLFRGQEKVFESRPVMATKPAEGREKTLPVLVEFPLPNVPPGSYIAQLTVIDAAGKRFAAARNPLVVLAAPKATP